MSLLVKKMFGITESVSFLSLLTYIFPFFAIRLGNFIVESIFSFVANTQAQQQCLKTIKTKFSRIES